MEIDCAALGVVAFWNTRYRLHGLRQSCGHAYYLSLGLRSVVAAGLGRKLCVGSGRELILRTRLNNIE